MSGEKLTPRPITPIKQSLEASCVVASITMCLQGFGVDVTEQGLIEKYFPTAKLPAGDLNAGVTNTNTVKGIVQILKDLGLDNSLQVDVFEPYLYQYTTNSSEKSYIVKVDPRVLRKYGNQFKKGDGVKEFLEAMEELTKKDEIGVYTANARMLGLDKKDKFGFSSRIPDHTRREFYAELTRFARKGHIVGPHGGMTLHTRALDGISKPTVSWRPDEEGFWIVDPHGEKYEYIIESLIMVDAYGVGGSTFDHLLRLSPKEEILDSEQYGFAKLLHKIRRLFS